MMYVKSSGEVIKCHPKVEEDLLQGTGASEVEEVLVDLNYHSAVHIGREHVAELEVHINSDRDKKPAAVALVTIGDYYEKYFIENRHAAILLVNQLAPAIRDICELNIVE